MTSDKNLRKVSTKELFQLNMPDWPLVLTGIILSAFIGTLFPLMAVLFSDVLRVSESPIVALASRIKFNNLIMVRVLYIL